MISEVHQVRLNLIAVALSIVALITSAATLAFVVFVPSSTLFGNPSFDTGFEAYKSFTRILLENNGTKAAHNVRIEVTYFSPPYSFPTVRTTQFVPEIRAGEVEIIEIPVGYTQLKEAIPEGILVGTSFSADVYVKCDETASVDFHFEDI
jgi:hypothetical protein